MNSRWICVCSLLLACSSAPPATAVDGPELTSSVLTRDEMARAMATPANTSAEFEISVPGQGMPRMLGAVWLAGDQTGRMIVHIGAVSYHPIGSNTPRFHVEGGLEIGSRSSLPSRDPEGNLVVLWRGPHRPDEWSGIQMQQVGGWETTPPSPQYTINRGIAGSDLGDRDIELRIDRRGLFVLTIRGGWFQDFGSNDDPRGRIGQGFIKAYGRLAGAGCAALCLETTCHGAQDPTCSTQPRIAELLRGWM